MRYHTLLPILSALPHTTQLKSSQPPTVILSSNGNEITYNGVLTSNIEHFYNVKYAASTSGENRFLPPQLFSPAAGSILDASVPGPACPQPKDAMLPFFSPIDEISEDCLHLHIARPAGLDPSSSVPVVV